MTEQEIQEDAAILDKALRQCGAELAQGGVNVLRLHAQQIAVMVRKIDRIEAAAASLRDVTAQSDDAAQVLTS